MGIWETLTDLVEAATPWATAEAEAPVATESTEETTTEAKEEETSAETESDESATADGEEEEGGEEEEEEEEDDEEIVDPKETLEEECRESKQCAPVKHHFDECVDRVTNASETDTKEDCVEEFFHLAHCATQCAAPKLWSQLK